MKRSLLTLLLTAFCFAAFSMDVPQQDTTKTKQQHAKKMGKKSSSKKMKNWKKMDSTGRDTMNNKTGKMDSTVRPQK
jgi:hypothetical protein